MLKIVIFIAISCFIAHSLGVFVPPRHETKKKIHLLGEKECTYGPSYWCQNLTNAADCHATKHCIQTVWIHKQLPPDTSNICDTCKQMVEQARDQLESNETQELIKEVFEGSCALLRVKPIVKECDKIADEYIPDLVETLASQMNPQVVCSVAGLCNNPRIEKLLAENSKEVATKPTESIARNRCDDCNTVMDIVVDKFNGLNENEFLNYLLEMCGKLSSYSDSCSNIIVKYFADIYAFLRSRLNANDVCLLSGECYVNFHKHDVEITPMSKIGYVKPENKDDLPCELCEQLVKHLRDILIANTTETEFKEVLQGLCKQTHGFKDQCLSIVNEYYGLIYNYLVDSLNATETCNLIGICPSSQKKPHIIAPLLFDDQAATAIKLKAQSDHVYIPEKDVVIKVIKPTQELTIGTPEQMQLPIDLLTPGRNVYSEQLCMFCQYFLHFVQQAISSPSAEADIKRVIDGACSKLPKSVNETCYEFVNTYEPAMVAILAQEIDPSQVCPMLRACPSDKVKDVDVFMNAKSSDKCPFCLAIVTEIESLAKGKTSKAEIKAALDKACNHLPGNLKGECTDFIDTYTDELVEMIIADFKPAEVCEYLKFCNDTTPASDYKSPEVVVYGGDTETNAIFDDTFNGKPIEHLGDETCVLCEFIMKELENELKDKKTDDEIKSVVHSICKVLPQSIRSQCDNFVDQYADAIIILLEESLEPSQICAMMKLCTKPNDSIKLIRDEVSNCGVCISAVDIIKTIMENPKIDRNIQHVFEKTCRGMPSDQKSACEKIIGDNGVVITTLLATGRDSKHVCEAVTLCSSSNNFLKIN